MDTGAIIMICFVAVLILFYVPPILYFKKGWFHNWFHDVMHWHQPDNSPKWSEGCSTHAKCKWCGEDIMQDSQGNWF